MSRRKQMKDLIKERMNKLSRRIIEGESSSPWVTSWSRDYAKGSYDNLSTKDKHTTVHHGNQIFVVKVKHDIKANNYDHFLNQN